MRKTAWCGGLLMLAMSLMVVGDADAKSVARIKQRIVFVGDSITDGHSYPLMVGQALQEAGKAVPTLINAGVASDVAAQMHARLERDVLVHHPTLVTFNAGTNDVMRGVTPEVYRAELLAIAERLHTEKIPMILITPNVVGLNHADKEPILDQYEAMQREVAAKYGYKIAENRKLQKEVRARGENPLEADNTHPNYLGQSLLARSVLDALGYTEVPLVKEFKPEQLPGVITPWQFRAMPDKTPMLDEKTVLDVKPDATWKTYTLPEAEPQKHWWMEQERKRGFGLSLNALIGPGKILQGVAVIKAPKTKKAYINTGGPSLQTVWLNGQRIFKDEGWTGWHAGKQRIPVMLKPGENTIVIETGNQFFLSLTDDNTW